MKCSRVLARTAAVVVIMAFGVANEVRAGDLSGPEVTTLLSGKTVYGQTSEKGQEVIFYFAADGVARQKKKGDNSGGTWRIDEGGRLCVQLRDPYSDVLERERCRVVVEERGDYKMYGVMKDGRRSLTMTIKQIVAGNAEGL